MADEEKEILDSENETEETVETQEEDSADKADEPKEADEPKFTPAEKKAHARAKKAEAEAKELKAKLRQYETKDKINTPGTESDPVKVAELANALRELSKEEIAFAKTIAAGDKISLLEAIETEGFKAYNKEKQVERKKAAAKLNATKGSGLDDNEPLVTPGMSREEHMKVAKQAMG